MTDLGKAVLKSGTPAKEVSGLALEKQQFNESHRSSWVEDSECTACSGCSKLFGVTRRKHHCRECGNIFCSKCSRYQVVVAGYVRRACLPCYKKVIEQSQVVAVAPKQQGNAAADNRNASITDNLAPRSSPEKKGKKSNKDIASTDDIYGRLSFAGATSSGYIGAVTGEVPDHRMSMLETSFAEAVEERPDIMSPWIHAILFFRTDDSQSPVLEASVPKGRISEDTIANILDHSMPEILNPADGYPTSSGSKASDDHDMIEYNYTYRVRCHDEDDDVSRLEGDRFLHCYVAFREVMNPKVKAMRRQSLVIVTRWAFPHFAYRLLGKIEEALWHVFTMNNGSVPEAASEAGDASAIKLSPASQALHVAYGQFLGWPAPVPDTPLSLPFFGEILQLTLPGNMFSQHQATTPMAAAIAIDGAQVSRVSEVEVDSKKDMAPVYAQSNLISVFGPLGLVPHLWAFWELLVTGRDIVVVAERPSLCSELVIALSTLTHPKGFKGEVWPFVSARGTLADDIRKTLKEKAQNIDDIASSKAKAGSKKWKPESHMEMLKTARFSTIIGITNPALLKQFDSVAAVIYASPSPVSWFGLDRYSSRLSASMRVYDSTQTFSEKTKGGNLSSSDFYMSSYRLWSRGVQRVLSGVDKREVTTLFSVQEEPTSGEQQRITKRLRKLTKKDYLPLGSMMLRDHFSELTRAFHKPLQAEAQSVASLLPVAPVIAAPTGILKAPSVRQRLQEDRPMLTDKQHRRQNIRQWVNAYHEWLQNNRPTAIMNAIVAASIVLYVYLGLPVILVIVGIYFMQIPEKAPKGVEIMLQAVFPDKFLYPNKYIRETAPALPTPAASPGQTAMSSTRVAAPAVKVSAAAGVTDFSGVWKRVKTTNFDNFVGAQGASYVQKKLAASMTITHTLTMNPPHCDMIRVQEKGGPMDSDKLYTVGGDPVELPQGKKNYLDSFYWSTTEPGVLVTKKVHVPENDYELLCKRYLEGNTIRMTFVFHDYATKKEVEASAIFEKVSDSPNEPPESSVKRDIVDSAPAGSADTPQAISGEQGKGKDAGKRVNFSGVWSAARRVNVEAYAGAQGAGYVQRKLAANAPMTHTFTTDEGVANYLGVRIEEKAGPINADTTYIANGSKSARNIMKRNYTESMTWEEDALVLKRVHEAGDFEIILTRRLEDGSDGTPEIVMTSLHRDLLTGKETEATIWWQKTGPSPNPPVVVPADKLGAVSASAEGSVTPPVAAAMEERASVTASEDGDSSDGEDMPVPASVGNSHFPRALSTTPRVDMTGVWKRVETHNYDAFVGAQGAGYVQRKLASSMALQHTIILDAPLFSEFTLQEQGGPLDTNLHYIIGSDVPVENFILKKKFLDTCDFEGGALVVTRRHDAGDFELVFRRYLETKDGQPVIRLVAIHRNLKTGDETESISFFRKVGEPGNR